MVYASCLKEAFKHYNKKYFGNKLDADTLVQFSDIGRNLGCSGRKAFKRKATLKERRENNLNNTAVAFGWNPWIKIHRKLRFSRSICMQTLLHEMVHVENPHFNHGPRFQRRMLKLAKQGAFNPWW